MNIFIYKGKLKMILIVSFLVFISNISYSQPSLPQRSISVQATQSLNFGTFALTGAGNGILQMGYDGFRSVIQNVFLTELAPTAQAAIFEIKLCQGRNVIINYDANTTLYGPNGDTLNLVIGPTERGANGASFAVDGNCNFITILRVGGTLHIPSTAYGGLYTGSFEIIFEQE